MQNWMMQKYTVHAALSLKIIAVCASALMKKTCWNKQGISGFNVYAKDESMTITMKRS